jgi:peptidoglycan/xylan/chitin deacetylase (PgdA/CDA1 family)
VIIKKAKQHLKWKINDALFGLNIKKISSTVKPTCIILVYHGIDEINNTKFNSRFISENIFEQHIKFFNENCNVISLNDYYNKNFDEQSPTVVITFDDGYANNLHRALPLLEQYKIPATFFITTIRNSGSDMLWADCLDLASNANQSDFYLRNEKFIYKPQKGYVSAKTNATLKQICKGSDYSYKVEMMKILPGAKEITSNKYYNEYWQLLSENEIKLLSESKYANIGAHGYYHNCLDKIKIQDAETELIKSKLYLENVMQKKIDSLAFPDGSYSEELCNKAFNVGYTKLLTTEDYLSKANETPILKTRLVVNTHISLFNQMTAIFNNTYY